MDGARPPTTTDSLTITRHQPPPPPHAHLHTICMYLQCKIATSCILCHTVVGAAEDEPSRVEEEEYANCCTEREYNWKFHLGPPTKIYTGHTITFVNIQI